MQISEFIGLKYFDYPGITIELLITTCYEEANSLNFYIITVVIFAYSLHPDVAKH